MFGSDPLVHLFDAVDVNSVWSFLVYPTCCSCLVLQIPAPPLADSVEKAGYRLAIFTYGADKMLYWELGN